MKDIQGTNDNLMVIAAHRYCLGRSSYIVGSCVDWLLSHWNKFETNTQNIIIRDTCEALIRNEVGMDMDRNQWVKLVKLKWQNLSDEDQDWLLRQIQHLSGYHEVMEELSCA